MVHPEQVGQLVGADLTAFHRVEHAELAVHERLGPAGQAEEHVAHPAAQFRLLHGDLHGRLLYRVERAPDLADLVGTRGERRRLDRHVDLIAPPDPLDHAGQAHVG